MTAPRRLHPFVARRLDPKEYLGLHLTIGLLVLGLALWGFGSLLDAVLDNRSLVRWDLAAAAWIHARTTDGGRVFFNFISEAASPDTIALLGAVVTLVLWRQKRFTASIAWVAAFVGGTVVQHILKAVVHRSRPEYGVAYLSDKSFSFPSGHSMAAMVGIGMSLYMLALFWHPGRAWRRGTIAVGVAIILLVGLSRVYLGVHYPSDVLGGYTAGAAWTAICISGLRVAQHIRRPRMSSV